MAFPFTYNFSKSFNRYLSKEETEQAYRYIYDFLQKKASEKTEVIIEITSEGVMYKGSTARNHILSVVNKGVFEIVNNDGESVLRYEIFIYKIFVILAAFSVVVTLITQTPWIILATGCIALVYCLSATGRHGVMLDDIKNKIDTLLDLKVDFFHKGE